MSNPSFCGGVPFDSLQPGDFVVVEVNGEPFDGTFLGFEVCHDQWCFKLMTAINGTEWCIPTCDVNYVMRPNQSQPFNPGDLHVGRVVLERCFRGDERVVR